MGLLASMWWAVPLGVLSWFFSGAPLFFVVLCVHHVLLLTEPGIV